VTTTIGSEVERIAAIRSRPVLADSAWIVETRADELTRAVARGVELTTRLLERAATDLDERRTHLRALSPQRTLDRGYAIAQTDDGAVLRSAGAAVPGSRVRLTLADGRVATIVESPRAETPTSTEGRPA
jgi:exodeoxyribonuclease VII large subunit